MEDKKLETIIIAHKILSIISLGVEYSWENIVRHISSEFNLDISGEFPNIDHPMDMASYIYHCKKGGA